MIQELSNGPQRILNLKNEVLRLGGQGNSPTMQELKNEVNTLQAAANIITTPTGGRQKLKLSPLMTYDGTPGLNKSAKNSTSKLRKNPTKNWITNTTLWKNNDCLTSRATGLLEKEKAEIAYRFTPSVDDTSSEEESDNEEET
ncbi:hypothetical protein K456DRAFT_1732163 [Colletotrichum gloeosporioides 23]|nr:hypothetical protein K456DRAFT_1732163 [Colletotrichum gloeosporioides 23]